MLVILDVVNNFTYFLLLLSYLLILVTTLSYTSNIHTSKIVYIVHFVAPKRVSVIYISISGGDNLEVMYYFGMRH